MPEGGLVQTAGTGGGAASGGARPAAAVVRDATTPADGMYHTMGAPVADGGSGATVTVTNEPMSATPIDRLLAGTKYSRADVDFMLSTITALILVWWFISDFMEG
ncbi:MAG: hypothetical protein ABEH78_07935 [Haloferacaceae archaeon]